MEQTDDLGDQPAAPLGHPSSVLSRTLGGQWSVL